MTSLSLFNETLRAMTGIAFPNILKEKLRLDQHTKKKPQTAQALPHQFSQTMLLWTEEAGASAELWFPPLSGHCPSSIS